MNALTQIYAVVLYLKLWIEDMIDYYHSYLILTLPSHMFGTPIFRTKSIEPESDSDSDSDTVSSPTESVISEIFIKRACLIHYDNNDHAYNTELHGNQLRHFMDEYGKFYIGHIEKYYPNLDTIILSYLKSPVSDVRNLNCDESDYEEEDPRLITRIIDVKKRYDVRNLQSCKMGVVL